MASSSRSLAGGGVAGSALAWSRRSAAPSELDALRNRDAEIAGSHQGGEPAGPADGVHDIRPLTAPARPQRVTERGYAGQRFRVTPLAGRADGDLGELAESGVVRARARAGARVQGVACCATMAIFIGCLLAGESSSRCLARETENDA